jgi:hypothetical protein
MMIEMDMSGSQDHRARSVLNLGQFLREIRNVMVVNERKSANDWFVRFNDLRQERLAYEIAERLGTVRVTALGDEPIELLQQVVFD